MESYYSKQKKKQKQNEVLSLVFETCWQSTADIYSKLRCRMKIHKRGFALAPDAPPPASTRISLIRSLRCNSEEQKKKKRRRIGSVANKTNERSLKGQKTTAKKSSVKEMQKRRKRRVVSAAATSFCTSYKRPGVLACLFLLPIHTLAHRHSLTTSRSAQLRFSSFFGGKRKVKRLLSREPPSTQHTALGLVQV
jgi:hypothetical protein